MCLMDWPVPGRRSIEMHVAPWPPRTSRPTSSLGVKFVRFVPRSTDCPASASTSTIRVRSSMGQRCSCGLAECRRIKSGTITSNVPRPLSLPDKREDASGGAQTATRSGGKTPLRRCRNGVTPCRNGTDLELFGATCGCRAAKKLPFEAGANARWRWHGECSDVETSPVSSRFASADVARSNAGTSL